MGCQVLGSPTFMHIFPREKRIGRLDYIFLQFIVQFLGWSLMGWLIHLLEDILYGNSPINSFDYFGLIVLGIGSLFLIFHQVFISFKRWHDLDKSGTYAFLLLLPIMFPLLQIGIVMHLCLKKGSSGPNRFGPPIPF